MPPVPIIAFSAGGGPLGFASASPRRLTARTDFSMFTALAGRAYGPPRIRINMKDAAHEHF